MCIRPIKMWNVMCFRKRLLDFFKVTELKWRPMERTVWPINSQDNSTCVGENLHLKTLTRLSWFYAFQVSVDLPWLRNWNISNDLLSQIIRILTQNCRLILPIFSSRTWYSINRRWNRVPNARENLLLILSSVQTINFLKASGSRESGL